MSARQNITRGASKAGPFTPAANSMLDDDRLSNEALGFLIRVLRLPADWKFSTAWACKKFRISRNKMHAQLNELIALGYCTRFQPRLANGRRGAFEYTFSDAPSPHPQNRDAVEVPHPQSPRPRLPDPVIEATTKTIDNKHTYLKATVDQDDLELEREIIAPDFARSLIAQTIEGFRKGGGAFDRELIKNARGFGVPVEDFMDRAAGRPDPSAYLQVCCVRWLQAQFRSYGLPERSIPSEHFIGKALSFNQKARGDLHCHLEDARTNAERERRMAAEFARQAETAA
jgi:hypothetical protein